MSDLLEIAIAAHGGRERWQELKRLRAQIAVGGAMWHVKGWPGALADVDVTVEPHKQHTEFSPFIVAGQHSVYEPDRTAIVADDGEVLEARFSPRESFNGHTLMTAWDAQHLAYFTGYAMWTYLTTPFLFELSGFNTEEIAPWEEEGEIWRRLKVTFPAWIHSHSREQIFYFNAAGILCRHDYSVDIMGGTASANYASEPKSFGGLIVPTKRRVYSIAADNRPVRDRVAVSIDILNINTE
jgi:hypothetical protein